MPFPFTSRHARLVLILAALPFLAGSSCAVFWSSDSGSSDERDRDQDDDRIIIVTGGQFTDPPVMGLRYVSGSTSGTTNAAGEYEYEPDKDVQFSIGDIVLGPPVPARPEMSAADLVGEDNQDASSEINIRRLLKSLDADPGSDTITIPEEVRSAAVTHNDAIAPAIEFLDFADDTAFANAASQLVAVLTDSYPFTALLVGPESVTSQPERSIER